MLQLIADTFPEHTKTVGIKMSGGTDSTLVAFALAKFSHLANLKLKLVPIVIEVNEFNYQINIVKKIIKKIQDRTNVSFSNLITYSVQSGNDLIPKMRDIEKELLKLKKVNMIASGAIHFPKTDDFCPPEGQGPIENRIGKFQIIWDGPIYTPFVNLDKKEIAIFYSHNNLLSDLFPLTRTCNKIKSTNIVHCKKCWSCLERLYGFGII